MSASHHVCGKKHRTDKAEAECQWRKAIWVHGEGRYAVLARCGELTITLWPTAEEAEEAKGIIDRSACGGRCVRDHQVILMRR